MLQTMAATGTTVTTSAEPVFRKLLHPRLSLDEASTVRSRSGYQGPTGLSPFSQSLRCPRLTYSTRRETYFRFLDLPAEPWIVDARCSLHRRDNLYWKWINYGKGPKRTTLWAPGRWPQHDFEIINALSMVCRTAHRETQGLVLALNTFHFDMVRMHAERIPSKCHNVDAGRNASVEADLEVFAMFENL